MADGSEKTAAQASLDAQYNADRKAAAQEYADVLKQIVLPVWDEEARRIHGGRCRGSKHIFKMPDRARFHLLF